MSQSPAVRRLHTDLTHLRKAQREGQNDHRDLRNDSRGLARDVKELAKNRKAGDDDHKLLDRAGKQLTKDVAARATAMKGFDQQKQVISDQLAADTFDCDAATPGVQQNPALLQQQSDLATRRSASESTFDTRIQADRDPKAKLGNGIKQDRLENTKDRSAIKRDRAVIKHDHAEIKHDRAVNKHLHARAVKDLRPAEYKMGLQTTNRVRHELGLSRVHQVIRPANLNSVQGCAQFLLNSKNVSYWSGLSSGSDRKNIERLARGEKAFVPATGGQVIPKLQLMQALVAMAKRGHIQINALTGGTHSVGSNHYSGRAVDLDVNVGNTGMIESIARQHGGLRNSETDHIHLDF